MKKWQALGLLSCLVALGAGPWAFADSRIEKTLKLEPGGRFVLDSDQGSVTVAGTAHSGAKVVITSNRDDLEDLFRFSFEGEPDLARVTARRRGWHGWPHNVSLHFEVEIPAKSSVDLKTGGGGIELNSVQGTARLETSGGPIQVSALTGKLEAHTSGGRIAVREVDGNADVETSGGSIEVRSLGGDLRAHTSGGPIRVQGITGRLEAGTSGGSVSVELARGNSRGGEVETSGGSITVGLDPKANLEIDASTSGGSVSSDLPITVVGKIGGSSLHGTLGSGGELLRLHTSGGSIHLEGR